jgi:NAD-dependent deacetylase
VTTNERYDRIAAALAGARRLLFITGAGLSADSGLPTYRGVGGLYDGVETADGIPIEEALSGETLRRDPALSWRYIMQIEAAGRGARPNRGHLAIAALEPRFEVHVLTQNVDGLHRAAGSTQVIDIHGDVHALLCTACEHAETVADYAGLACPPRCPACGAVLRPDVVLFGEMLPLDKVARLAAELDRGFDAVFSVGTSSLFPYVAEPVLRARAAGVMTVEINPRRTAVSDHVTERLVVGASEALEAIVDRI